MFDECSLLLAGSLRVTTRAGGVDVGAAQAVSAHKGEWVRYSTPEEAEYIAVCVRAFTPEAAHRDSD